MTYKESERGNAMDHTSPPVSTTTPTNPASNLSLHELIVLGFMPARDDFEVEFENEGEILVSGIQACSGGSRVESDDEEVMLFPGFCVDLVIICVLAGDWFEVGTGGHVQEQVEGEREKETSCQRFWIG
jgi:hypothetical protein